MVATQQIEINTLYHGSMLSSIPVVSAQIFYLVQKLSSLELLNARILGVLFSSYDENIKALYSLIPKLLSQFRANFVHLKKESKT